MINKILFVFFIFTSINCFSEDKISIGISAPFIKTQEVNSIFYQKQFIFELISSYNDDKNSLQILNINVNDNESDYLTNCKSECRKNNYDYLLYSIVYIIKSKIYFKAVLINPYNDNTIFLKLFSGKNDYTVNEFLINNTKEIINIINSKNIIKIKIKKIEETKIVAEFEAKSDFKHEVFIMNGIFKNTPFVMSLTTWYIGYSFIPFKFFNIEACFFFGSGYYEDYFNLKTNFFDNFYIGGYGAFHFFIPGEFVEPNIGVRFDIGYLINKDAFFSIPFDIGIKIKVRKNDWIRINSSFQYLYYDFNTQYWENNIILGFMIGYARKI